METTAAQGGGTFIFYIFFFVIIRGVRKRSKGSEVKPNTPAKSAQQSAEVFRNS